MDFIISATMSSSAANLIIEMSLRRIENETYKFTKSNDPKERLKIAHELTTLTNIIAELQVKINLQLETHKW
jgi:hypothetical protein